MKDPNFSFSDPPKVNGVVARVGPGWGDPPGAYANRTRRREAGPGGGLRKDSSSSSRASEKRKKRGKPCGASHIARTKKCGKRNQPAEAAPPARPAGAKLKRAAKIAAGTAAIGGAAYIGTLAARSSMRGPAGRRAGSALGRNFHALGRSIEQAPGTGGAFITPAGLAARGAGFAAQAGRKAGGQLSSLQGVHSVRRQVGNYRRVLLRKIKEREGIIAGLLKEWKSSPPKGSEVRRLRAKRLKYERSTLRFLQRKAEGSQQAKRQMGRIELNRRPWSGAKPRIGTHLTMAMILQMQKRAKKSGHQRGAFVNRLRRQAID